MSKRAATLDAGSVNFNNNLKN